MNYNTSSAVNTVSCDSRTTFDSPCAEPKIQPTVVQMTDELIIRLRELLGVANNVTTKLDGAFIDMPNGGDGTMPERMKWCIELISRVTSTLRNSGEFLG